jgi:RNA polymerase sporulation-specific sigma factor
LLCDVLGSDADVINQNIEQELECNLLLEAVSKLNTREAMIMELRFGLNGNKEHTQKQVADLMGISQSYISRLEKRIIEKLKTEIEAIV